MVPTFNQLAGEDGSSVSLAFKKQLDDLKTELESSACHFVRCLKCNRSKVSATEHHAHTGRASGACAWQC